MFRELARTSLTENKDLVISLRADGSIVVAQAFRVQDGNVTRDMFDNKESRVFSRAIFEELVNSYQDALDALIALEDSINKTPIAK